MSRANGRAHGRNSFVRLDIRINFRIAVHQQARQHHPGNPYGAPNARLGEIHHHATGKASIR